MLIYKNTVYREVSLARARKFALNIRPAQDPELPGIDLTKLDLNKVKTAKQMIKQCDTAQSKVRPYCVYIAEGRIHGAFFSYAEAFKNAYMWLERKEILGRD